MHELIAGQIKNPTEGEFSRNYGREFESKLWLCKLRLRHVQHRACSITRSDTIWFVLRGAKPQLFHPFD